MALKDPAILVIKFLESHTCFRLSVLPTKNNAAEEVSGKSHAGFGREPTSPFCCNEQYPLSQKAPSFV